MKKYKLIKSYPGCTYNVGEDTLAPEYITRNNKTLYLKDYPEFWEEVIEKEYKIMGYGKITVTKDLWSIDKNGRYRKNANDTTSQSTFTKLNENNTYYINSVKRLSDGKIFTIGDITNRGVICTITAIDSTICINQVTNSFTDLQHANQLIF